MTALAPITVRGSFARASQTVGRCASERPRWPVGTGDSLTRPARWHQTARTVCDALQQLPIVLGEIGGGAPLNAWQSA